MMNEPIRVINILNGGAIDVTRLESRGSSSSSNLRGVYFRFTIHASGNGPKPPIAMFVTDLIRIQRGTRPNFLIMEHEVGNGAFYFGLFFASIDRVNRFLETLTELKVWEEIEGSEKMEAIGEKLFEEYCK